MTNNEAIERLRGILTEVIEFENSVCYVTEEDREPLEMAIKALEQKECEDCISREAVLEIFGYVMDYWAEHAIDVEPHEIEDSIIEQYTFTAEELSKLPPVTPQTKIGHWIDDNDGHGTSCSECGKWYPHSYLTKQEIIYCCKCGAKMIGPQESEE